MLKYVVDELALTIAWHIILQLHLCISFISGVGEDAFETVEQFQDYLKPSVVRLTYHDCDADDRVVAFFMFYPTSLSRSFRPLNLGKYRNIGSIGDV